MKRSAQLIGWDKMTGVFRFANPIHNLMDDLENCFEVEGFEIDPNSINLIKSVSLLPRFVKIDAVFSKSEKGLEPFKDFHYGIITEIIQEAQKLAGSNRVPYFGVDILNRESKTYVFGNRDVLRCLSSLATHETDSTISHLEIQPTVQLYTLRG